MGITRYGYLYSATYVVSFLLLLLSSSCAVVKFSVLLCCYDFPPFGQGQFPCIYTCALGQVLAGCSAVGTSLNPKPWNR